ncbi:unnamed protein product, partial [Polarella glacialis]
TLAAVRVVGRPDNPVAKDWMAQFAPMLRYGNPNLVCDFRSAKQKVIVEAPVVEDEAEGEASAEGAEAKV